VISASKAPRWWRTGVNAAVVVLVLGVALASVGVAIAQSATTGTRIGAALELIGLAALVMRRRAPAAVLAFEVGIAVACDALATSAMRSATVVAVVIALYGFALAHRTMQAVVAALATGLAVGVSDLLRTGQASAVGSHLVLVTAVTAVGFYVRSHRALLESYRERAEQAEREQRWHTNEAVAAERVRIARELHDVIAHHVSLLVVQAGAVRETLPGDHVTRPVLDSMIDGGRHAMTELRDMLDALRLDEGAPRAAHTASAIPHVASGDAGAGTYEMRRSGRVSLPSAERSPQPTAEDIPSLVAGAGAAGLPVEIHVEGTPVPLAPTTSLAAYRIAQEALTNVVKHAPGAPTAVLLDFRAGSLILTVRNRRPVMAPPPAFTASGGYGIVGMRERAAMARGTLSVGPYPGGWELRAELPGRAVAVGSR
jgi:signal transduction histidine kinase